MECGRIRGVPDHDELELLGHGPDATGGGGGWRMATELVFRCTACGTDVSADPNESGRCACGALSKDAAVGRIGSRLGDHAIAVYRRR